MNDNCKKWIKRIVFVVPIPILLLTTISVSISLWNIWTSSDKVEQLENEVSKLTTYVDSLNKVIELYQDKNKMEIQNIITEFKNKTEELNNLVKDLKQRNENLSLLVWSNIKETKQLEMRIDSVNNKVENLQKDNYSKSVEYPEHFSEQSLNEDLAFSVLNLMIINQTLQIDSLLNVYNERKEKTTDKNLSFGLDYIIDRLKTAKTELITDKMLYERKEISLVRLKQKVIKTNMELKTIETK